MSTEANAQIGCISGGQTSYNLYSYFSGDLMTNEVTIGLDFVNTHCNTSYSNPEDVIVVGEQLAVDLLAGEDVDYEFDSHRMAVSLFASGGVIRPLESAVMRQACELWLDRHSRR